ncbi:hypothetical protein HDV03_001855 [Kappamyces sp. JEL0829]|nr:hypothetical protein HDV03_001855 [Kappamyces sp. JEL0829]
MRGPKKPKFKPNKQKKVEYNSDSDAEPAPGNDFESQLKELSAKEMLDLDIVGASRRDSDSGLSADEDEELAETQERREKKEKIPGKSAEEVEMQKTTKMASVISKILDTEANAKRPVLSLKRKIEADIDEAKLVAKAKKLLSSEKKQKIDVGRVIPDHSTTDYEKKLRKVATRGVVQLFNALRAAQKTAQDLALEGIQKNAAIVPSVSKQSFLQSLKQDERRDRPATPATSASTAEQSIPFLREEFSRTAPKHWDQDDDE